MTQSQYQALRHYFRSLRRNGYQTSAVTLERWGDKHIAVVCDYRRADWQSAMSYHDCIRIGPRGGKKEIYHSLY